ncbi:unnamed protein product [Heligmosomoides polygyrus]|uniref:Uncharacterized protein n=1 Tax=Heligmosomoides polygyrus TaxID=6339 RepID=A0A183FT00_HELPZ|nr:unnamed protein product [Heligmosomoides polygyrus]
MLVNSQRVTNSRQAALALVGRSGRGDNNTLRGQRHSAPGSPHGQRPRDQLLNGTCGADLLLPPPPTGLSACRDGVCTDRRAVPLIATCEESISRAISGQEISECNAFVGWI